MYSKEQIEKAIQLHQQGFSQRKIIRLLGYPGSRNTLSQWIVGKEYRYSNKTIQDKHFRPFYSNEFKIKIVNRCIREKITVKCISEETGISPPTIYSWIRKYGDAGVFALMSKKRTKTPNQQNDLTEVEELKKKVFELQLEVDIMKETINLLKKDQGVNLKALCNREKTILIDALKQKYNFSLLLQKLDLAKSSYYYHEKVLKSEDKLEPIRNRISSIFYSNYESFGYRRIHLALKSNHIRISEKIVRRIMQENNLKVKHIKMKRYSSYKGELCPPVPNRVNRNFHAVKPNMLWLTDITEFTIPAGKIYLSPIIDCYDGGIVSYSIGTHPNAALVNSMLDKAIETLNTFERPMIHSDRGCHYQWPGWIKRMEEAGLTRSMSKKGYSPDNAACEGFFGRLKNEFFYNRDWRGISIESFIRQLEEYLTWYNERRIKASLGGLSPIQYRKRQKLIA